MGNFAGIVCIVYLIAYASRFAIEMNIGRVLELLINSKKASTSLVFEENAERFLCLRFSITHTHDLNIAVKEIVTLF